MNTQIHCSGVSLVNNKGDMGKTLKDMGSSQNVKGVLTAMATAGVLTELGSTTTATGQTGANAQAVTTAQEANQFTSNLMRNVTNNMASAVVSSAINGKPLNEETLSTALTSAFITAGMAQAANSIGDATSGKTPALNSYTQATAHALAGCVGGAATTGNSGGCSAGAVGAVVGELSAGYAKSTGATDANALAFAKSMSAVAGALVGGPDSAAAVNVAAQMGANAAENNRMLHPSDIQKAKDLAAKSGGKYTQSQIEEQMRLMGNAATGELPNTITVLTNTDAVVNSLKNDPSMPKVTDGRTVVEVAGQADVGIQKYIMDNTKEGAGFIPGVSPYVASNASLNKPTTTNTPPSASTAKCANGDTSCISGVGVQQNAPISAENVANAASTLSRQAGVVGAAATAATAAASPQIKPITGSVAVGATVIGVAADAVEQMARPDTGQVIQGSVTKYFQEWTDKKIPSAAPITNEIVEAWRASGISKSIGDWTNQQWEAFLSRTAK